ncbi:MAG: hypothetical protein CSA75_03730, partial [Sorangium cellulosum]
MADLKSHCVPKPKRDEHVVVHDVVKRFGKTVVLDHVSMKIKRGQTAVVIGGSGAGKTTL